MLSYMFTLYEKNCFESFNSANESTATAQSGSTYYTVSVVGDNAYGGFGNLVSGLL